MRRVGEGGINSWNSSIGLWGTSDDGVSYSGARGSGERSCSVALAKRDSELAFNYTGLHLHCFLYI